MLQRRTVIQAAYNKVNGFSYNINPENVRSRHAEEIVAAKQHVYSLFLQKLDQELNDSEVADEWVHEASAAEVFEHLMAEISAQQEALHDISRALMNSHNREDPAHPTGHLPEAPEAVAAPAT